MDEKLVQLSTPPSAVAESYKYMWSYGALLRCFEDESTSAYSTFDSGICTSVSERAVDRIEVGILKGIYRVSFAGWNIIILKVDWVKQDTIRKDRFGFWTCNLNNRETRRSMNPFLLPMNAEQVYFMEDVLSPDWKIVLRHDPRARRIVGNSEVAFGLNPTNTELDHQERSTEAPRDISNSAEVLETVRQIPTSRVHELDATLNREEDDAHFDDNEYEDDSEEEL